MKRLLCVFLFSAFVLPAPAQGVIRLSNNTSYDWGFALNNTTIMLRSAITKTIWAYNIPGNTFTQLSTSVLVEGDYQYGIMDGKLYFAGRTSGEGIELWISDGLAGPTHTYLLKDINTIGIAANSEPKYGFVVYNSNIYFTANDGTNGRELWKSDGTETGTEMVKNINPGSLDAFPNSFIPNFKVIGGVLVFSASIATDGDEIWKTDGTVPGTIQLKKFNSFPGLGSNISSFTEYGTILIFTASEFFDQAIWKTDGSVAGTVPVKDINPDVYPFTVSPPFFNFKNELYFSGDDGTSGFELWKTDGTADGTVLVKDIDPGDDGTGAPNNGLGFTGLIFAVKNSSKFFFSATTADEGTELWESDGTESGTRLLKDIATGSGISSNVLILPNFFTHGLFQGNKFFLVANTPAKGFEYYVSDGTAGGTVILKDINPDAADGLDIANLSYFYTDSKFFFVANNGINGPEPWQTDGTTSGTGMLEDVNEWLSPANGSDVTFTTLASGTLFFFATDGDNDTKTDFFKVNGTFTPLPLRWISIEARPYNDDVLLIWKTAEEEQTDYFVIQRSADGINYYEVGRVNANRGLANNYTFTDAGAMKQAGIKKWFYRIKDVDKDGKSAMSRIVTVALNKTMTQIFIRPNPAVNELKLVIDAVNNSSAVIRVMNMEGKIVLQRSVNVSRGENVITNDISHLPNGTYLLQTVADGSTTVERFLIQR